VIEIVRAEEKHVADIGKLWWEFMLFHQEADPIFTRVKVQSQVLKRIRLDGS
jgi:uncharacterized ferritin-like protein (DUF455 family)